MSLRIVPENKQLSAVSTTTFGEISQNAPGLQDTLREQKGPLSIASKLNDRHPLESRIANWEETQLQTRLEMYRRVYGASEPIRRTMDLKIIEATDFKPQVLGGSDSMHKDILLNKEANVDWEDVYKGGFEYGEARDFHSEMEAKLGI
ncbi:putative proteasome maturation factor [Clavispora lusitaniae]|uniref:Proteasome maturation factor n=1 Tax=Clavispora lusitaniae TaxID=36911 RepID=A0ACD0WML1_CLALS|nr:putative proteasome maturation factor [Clavispora lusitaniae]QFZ34173.1 putative proteasome maturation factor [Clavispora lusitaniae]QFZ39857.1 putative proteasome maturation factor [Clavispora lusitaniae]QFZ45539.1 putative proteasome maturation factor [Clavispora lusitaniae]QFZ51203.1 putative proteasome maturation factor [Clavispora lusitaniae]